MAHKLNIYLITCFLFFATTIVAAKEQQLYISPNGKYKASVVPLPKAAYGSGESKVEILSANNMLLFSKSYASEDGEHGFGVEHASWTADSKFFVYNMSSSGGHQAWHFPTEFIAVEDWKVRSLDDYLGPLTEPHFTLRFPDIVETTGREKQNLEETKFEIRLGELLKSKTK